jgi:predicted transcriptional regulator
MEEKNENLQVQLSSLPLDKITKQTIIAFFNKEKLRLNYNKILQGLKSLEITPATLKSDYEEIKEANKFIKSLDTWRKEAAKPFNEVDAAFLQVFKEIIEPISVDLMSIKAKIKSASDINAAEIAKAKKEQERIDNIIRTMSDFINKITVDITMATTDKEISSIQMRIGSEKSRETFYGTYIEELKSKCNNLNGIINDQKEKIRQLKKFNEDLEKAIANNDDSKAVELKEQIEITGIELNENAIRLQEKAFTESVSISQTVVGQPDLNVTKGRLYRWKWQVENIDLLRKKNPELTKIVPYEKAIDTLLKQKRDAGDFKDLEELNFNGIKFFKEKYL